MIIIRATDGFNDSTFFYFEQIGNTIDISKRLPKGLNKRQKFETVDIPEWLYISGRFNFESFCYGYLVGMYGYDLSFKRIDNDA